MSPELGLCWRCASPVENYKVYCVDCVIKYDLLKTALYLREWNRQQALMDRDSTTYRRNLVDTQHWIDTFHLRMTLTHCYLRNADIFHSRTPWSLNLPHLNWIDPPALK